MNLEIIRATGDIQQRDQIIDVVISRMKISEAYYLGVRQRWPRLYDLWRGTWTGRFHPHKNNVHIPLIFSAIWADAARKAATSLNMWPIVSFLGYGPDDASIARKREALISAQMKDDDAFMKQTDAFVQADLYGVSLMEVGWKRTKEKRIIEFIDHMPITGKTVKSLKKGEIVSFDGPFTDTIDLLDAFPQPGYRQIRNGMKWFVRRSFLDLDEIRFLVSEGVFEKGEFDRMISEGGVSANTSDQNAMIRRFAVRTGMDDESVRWMDRYTRPIELLTMWGYMPSELCPDGVLKRIVTVANRRYLFRNRPIPFWHNQIPIIENRPTPDPHYFYPAGKAEVTEKLQIVGNRYLNQSLDAADLMIDPMWFYDRGANLNTRNLYARPGRFIPVDGDPSRTVAPLMPNIGALTISDNKINQIREYAQMGMGIQDDVVQGLEGGDRQTAREFMGRREASGTRLLLESRLYEEGTLEPLANMMVALDKQFLETPVEVLILGDSSTIDPVTGNQMPVTREQLDDYDLVPNYAARAVGASAGLSKSSQKENMQQLLMAMGTPVGQAALGAINAVNFWRGIFRIFEVPNINEIFSPQAQNNPLAQLVQQANGGAGGGVGNVPTSGQIVNGGALPLPGAAQQGIPPEADMSNTLPPQMMPG
jgi:hypothetical protein